MTIIERKAEILDLIMNQETLKHQYGQLDQIRQQKFAELQQAIEQEQLQQSQQVAEVSNEKID